METPDLEIVLYKRDNSSYHIELRYSSPQSDADIRRHGNFPLQIDKEKLLEVQQNDAEYGKYLGEALLGQMEILTTFEQARANAQALDTPLRVRLFIGPDAMDLQQFRWETLCHPQDNAALFTNESLLFSRYLSSNDWRAARLLPFSKLRALVVVANPSNIDGYQIGGESLTAIDAQAEVERISKNLPDVHIDELATRGQATLSNIIATLREGYDFLYLVCHGAIIDDVPRLWLEDKSGQVEVVDGRDLVTRMGEMTSPPRLIVLVSCQSMAGGQSEQQDDARVALGPRLAEAGVPAVLAMHGNISIDTVNEFMPVFFKELLRDGHIDRAIAVARGQVRDRADWWMPVLFMRLKSGRLWYLPGFTDDKHLEKWPAIISNIQQKKCTPIIGPSLIEPLLGSRREIAKRWAQSYHFPLSPHLSDDLPQVAQYLAINQQPAEPQVQLLQHLRKEMEQSYGKDLPKELLERPDVEGIKELADQLEKIINFVGLRKIQSDKNEPHRILSELPLPIYVTTNYNNLLAVALKEHAKKDPKVEICRWSEELETLPSIMDTDYRPSIEQPLIYHLFGRLNVPESLLLTEDNYFDFLIGVTRNEEMIPPAVMEALVDTGLLFLGFHLEEWNFRIILRSLNQLFKGARRRERYAQVAAQIDPEESQIIDPEGARKYLEDYFRKSAQISIFWGPPSTFMQELRDRPELKKYWK